MNHASYRSNSYFLYNHRLMCNNMMNSLNRASREQGLRIRHSSNWQEQVSRAHDAWRCASTARAERTYKANTWREPLRGRLMRVQNGCHETVTLTPVHSTRRHRCFGRSARVHAYKPEAKEAKERGTRGKIQKAQASRTRDTHCRAFNLRCARTGARGATRETTHAA